MAKQTIDLKALLESKLGDVIPTEADISTIERVSKAIPKNLMFNAETTEFKPITKPVTTTGAKQMTVEEAKQFNLEMDRFIDECLVSGVDYGVIPHCQKPTLLKSGAEKIAIFLGIIFRTEVVSRLEDFSTGVFAYECKVYGIDVDGIVRGEGVATANSKESKYAKSSGYSVQNVILKMCKKRALVDCVLNIGGLSSRFTQDVEDMDLQQEQVGKSADELKPQAKTPRPATKKQLEYLQKLMQQHGNTSETMNRYVKQAYGVDNFMQITNQQASELIEKYKATEQ